MIIRLVAFLVFLATPLLAQDLPALYDVHDVAADDVLNIRAEPTSASGIIGALTPSAKNIEVIRAKNGWAQINAGEQTGWIFMQFIKPSNAQPLHGYPAQCFGTEPFWSLRNGSSMVFEQMGDAPIVTAPSESGSASRSMASHLSVGVNGSSKLIAIITQEACDDGMSDHAFGLSIDLVVKSPEGHRLLTGCCTLR